MNNIYERYYKLKKKYSNMMSSMDNILFSHQGRMAHHDYSDWTQKQRDILNVASKAAIDGHANANELYIEIYQKLDLMTHSYEGLYKDTDTASEQFEEDCLRALLEDVGKVMNEYYEAKHYYLRILREVRKWAVAKEGEIE